MKKKTVAVIFGAYSSEYPVSLKSAHNVLTHMNYDKYDVICIGITDDGKWLRYNGDIDKIFNDEWRKNKEDCAQEQQTIQTTQRQIIVHYEQTWNSTKSICYKTQNHRRKWSNF